MTGHRPWILPLQFHTKSFSVEGPCREPSRPASCRPLLYLSSPSYAAVEFHSLIFVRGGTLGARRVHRERASPLEEGAEGNRLYGRRDPPAASRQIKSQIPPRSEGHRASNILWDLSFTAAVVEAAESSRAYSSKRESRRQCRTEGLVTASRGRARWSSSTSSKLSFSSLSWPVPRRRCSAPCHYCYCAVGGASVGALVAAAAGAPTPRPARARWRG